MDFGAIAFTLFIELISLRAKKYYSDCSPDKSLIRFSISGCGEDTCAAAGGEPIAISLAFKPKIKVFSGRAKLCLTNLKPGVCHPAVARIPDICEKIIPNCPMEPGRVYTYEHVLRTPNIAVRTEQVYKLYDEKCNMIACVDYVGELRSANTNLSQLTVVDDTHPCKN